jgi:hypothetical protein
MRIVDQLFQLNGSRRGSTAIRHWIVVLQLTLDGVDEVNGSILDSSGQAIDGEIEETVVCTAL